MEANPTASDLLNWMHKHNSCKESVAWVSAFGASASIEAVYDALPASHHAWLCRVLMFKRDAVFEAVAKFSREVLDPLCIRVVHSTRNSYALELGELMTDAQYTRAMGMYNERAFEVYREFKEQHREAILSSVSAIIKEGQSDVKIGSRFKSVDGEGRIMQTGCAVGKWV